MNKKYFSEEEKKRAILDKNARYHKKAFTSFTIKYHNINDEDVIAKLKGSENITDYIRQLVRNDIK